MHKRIYSLILLLISQAFSLSLLAQGTPDDKKVEMADAFRANGKIYVVITIVLVILAGLILYVARLDRKISRFEKEIK